MGRMLAWRVAMRQALYGPGGFYIGHPPDGHFRTSAQTPAFAAAIAELVRRLDAALDHPDPFTVVDMGAGRAALLSALLEHEPLAGRLRAVAVELRPRPAGLDRRVGWRATPPASFTGLVLACEWLDNQPCDIAECDDDGVRRYQLVDPKTGATALGTPVTGEDAAWLDRWWPLTEPGRRAEIGLGRDRDWHALTNRLERGLAVAVDYGHTVACRPPYGTMTGYAHGRQLPPIPDGSRDITAHVAMDSLDDGLLLTQRQALRALGTTGARPPIDLAHSDPGEYLRRLSQASQAADLTEPSGLGAHHWLLTGVGCRPEALLT
jgi:SAM-dependent MidA family methyltransferase